MSPGYESSKTPDFDRPVTPDCLVCHSGRALPVPGTFNTYQKPPFEAEAIGCERCHGPLESHLHNPLPGSIVNPANLPPRARDSVCEQCHLNGERIPNPGKQLSDFRPGQDLEEVYTVYVSAASRDPSRPNPLKVVSQVHQLALSTCARKSQGKLWCGTCHDPHLQPADPKTYFRDRCLSCHGVALLKSHSKPSDDCIRCHMPLRPVTDGAHTVFTDHRISRRPLPQSDTAGSEEPPALVAWHDPPATLAQRNLGLADVRVGVRRELPPLVSQGFQLLYACCSDLPDDPPVLTGIGNALLAAGQTAFAVAVFERAIQIEPENALNYLHAGLAEKALHDKEKAVDYLEKAVQLDPLLEQSYLELAKLYAESHDARMLQRTNERYLKAFPQSVRAQMLFLNNAKPVSP
jgi:tetratricopeptide (TPR) repeat protein